jgi:valyl-tRNA synthetase
MIMASTEFMDSAPFRDIYIHGLVRDIHGRKMSKSLGNGIDPLEIVEEYGADALKFTLAFQAAQGPDVLINKDSFKFGSKFANKIWNATRYLLMNLEGRELIPFDETQPDDIDRWILHRLNNAVRTTRKSIENYRFNEAAQSVYEFFWNDFCDWYIEASKLTLHSDDGHAKNRIVSLLMYILEETLRLLHPFVSFVTEEIYQKLPNVEGNLVTAPYPLYREDRTNPKIDKNFAVMQELVRGVRTLRSEFTISPSAKIKVHVAYENDSNSKDFLIEHHNIISMLVTASELTLSNNKENIEGSIPFVGSEFEAYVYIKDVIDVPREVMKLEKEKKELEKLIQGTRKKLSNPRFLENAPEDVVEKEKSKLQEFTRRNGKIGEYIEELS